MSPCRAPFNMFAVLRCACRAEERMKNSYVFLSPTLGAKRSTGWLAVFALTAICALGVTRDSFEAQKPATLPAATTVDFARDIQPILERRCQACHGFTNATKGLRLDQRAAALQGGESGPAMIPGNSERSWIIRWLLGLDGLSRMPKSGDPLTADQIALIRSWIDEGAHWPEGTAAAATTPTPERSQHWAYRSPTRPPLPPVRDTAWARTPIDRFVLARLENEGPAPSPTATLETLVRRVSLDLIGLPPSPHEV